MFQSKFKRTTMACAVSREAEGLGEWECRSQHPAAPSQEDVEVSMSLKSCQRPPSPCRAPLRPLPGASVLVPSRCVELGWFWLVPYPTLPSPPQGAYRTAQRLGR